jgi:hypothetical protein
MWLAQSVLFVLLVSCGGDDLPAPDHAVTLAPMSAVDHLVRASLALRGVRPSVSELESVLADPDALSGIVDDYLDSDEFLLTMADMHGEQLKVRTETLRLPALGPLEGVEGRRMFEALSESSLELVKHIVGNDLPYTDLVTADYTMGSALSSEIILFMEGFDPAQTEKEWQQVTWSDGRPMAGVLSDPGLWVRHVSNGNNYHRARSNFIADTFLCSSFLTRDIPISGGIDLADDEAVAHAVSTQTECVGCHQALDPLAATLWGTREINPTQVNRAYANNCEEKDQYDCYPVATYNPDAAGQWEGKGLRAPGYYGLAVDDLGSVGELLAGDPRFSQCAVRRFYSYLAQVEREILPRELVVDFAESFESSHFDAKALAKRIVLSEPFAVAHEAVVDAEPHVAALQILRPRQVSRAVAALTGFEWRAGVDDPDCLAENRCWGEVDLFLSDGFGFRVMMGGADGYVVSKPTHTSTPVRALVMEAFAAEASSFAVDTALSTGQSDLLTVVGPDTKDEATIRLQLVALHKLLWAEFVASDSTEVDETFQLYSDIASATGDIPLTWKMVLSAFFQDTRFTHY